jgi:hypothetical protein
MSVSLPFCSPSRQLALEQVPPAQSSPSGQSESVVQVVAVSPPQAASNDANAAMMASLESLSGCMASPFGMKKRRPIVPTLAGRLQSTRLNPRPDGREAEGRSRSSGSRLPFTNREK